MGTGCGQHLRTRGQSLGSMIKPKRRPAVCCVAWFMFLERDAAGRTGNGRGLGSGNTDGGVQGLEVCRALCDAFGHGA